MSSPMHRSFVSNNQYSTVTAHDDLSSSPFIQFSRRTIEEHKVTLSRFEAQLRQISQSVVDLDIQADIDRENSVRVLQQLQQEEETIIRREQQCIEKAAEIEERVARENTQAEERRVELEKTEKSAKKDLSVLEDLEEELNEMKAKIENKLYCSKEQLRSFKMDLDKGLKILETDMNAVRAIAECGQHQLEQSQRTVRYAESLSPDRRRESPLLSNSNRCNSKDRIVRNNTSVTSNVREIKSISPSRDRRQDISPVNTALESRVSPPKVLKSPRKSGRQSHFMLEAEMLNNDMEAIKQQSLDESSIGSVDRTHRLRSSSQSVKEDPSLPLTVAKSHAGGILAPNFSSLFDGSLLSKSHSSSNLLNECAKVPIDVSEVRRILRQDPSSINTMDRFDNNPLHIACMNPQPSIDAVHALLLAGCSTTTRNSCGMTPFHLACINVDGDGTHHLLKRFLIFKGSQNPNQRTSRGETALHLCAEDDKYVHVAEFLLTVGVDSNVSSLLEVPDGTSRRMTAYDVACVGGERSAKVAELLQTV